MYASHWLWSRLSGLIFIMQSCETDSCATVTEVFHCGFQCGSLAQGEPSYTFKLVLVVGIRVKNQQKSKLKLHHFISDRYQYCPSRYELHALVRVRNL